MRIGVVVPAFNAAEWIGDAIRSVLAQTHQDWSLVVVDDGSTDGTADAVAGFSDARIGLLRQANAGVSSARNRGIDAVIDTSAGVLFLDADDWLAPDALTRLVAAFSASPEAVAVAGAFAFSERGQPHVPPAGELLPGLLMRNPFANGGQLLLRRAAVQAAGGFLSHLTYGEDWEFLIRIARQGPFAIVQDNAPVLFVRRHAAGAYARLAGSQAAFTPCMDAIYRSPELHDRFGAETMANLRRRAEAENEWIIGREQIRHGSCADGLARLRRSVRAMPGVRRSALLMAAHALALLPPLWRGPLRPYSSKADAPSRAPHQARGC